MPSRALSSLVVAAETRRPPIRQAGFIWSDDFIWSDSLIWSDDLAWSDDLIWAWSYDQTSWFNRTWFYDQCQVFHHDQMNSTAVWSIIKVGDNSIMGQKNTIFRIMMSRNGEEGWWKNHQALEISYMTNLDHRINPTLMIPLDRGNLRSVRG